MKIKNGIIYQGPSQIDGSPIVVIATQSANRKTGAMIQTWIIRRDVHPVEAWKTGEDESICGDCTHRGVWDGKQMTKRTCYVTWFPVMAVYKTFKAGKYPILGEDDLASLVRDKNVRLGAYGDPAAVPYHVWENVLRGVAGHTGYTHQWRTCDKRFANICMASTDTLEDRFEAVKMGYRYFGIGPKTIKQEVVCPASDLGKITCAECMACGGFAAKVKANIVIELHGGAGTLGNAKSRWGGLQPAKENMPCLI